jgi:DNA-binding CsgD family transcriptional regulator
MAQVAEIQFEACVDCLYEAVTTPEGLKHAISSVRNLLGAVGANTFQVDSAGVIRRFVDDGHDPAVVGLYLQHYAALDPMRFPVLSLKPGQWACGDEALDPKRGTEPEFANDFAPLAGMRWFRGGKVFENDDWTAVVSLQRPADAKPFDAEDMVLLNRLTPHLGRMWRLIVDLQDVLPALAGARAAMDKLSNGFCVLDRECRVVYANTSAETILRSGGPLRVRNGRIDSATTEARAALHQALARATGAPRLGSAFTIKNSLAGTAAFIKVVPLPETTPLAHLAGADGGLLALLVVAGNPGVIEAKELGQLFGLTRAEAELVQLLVDGRTPAECAEYRETSVATVRTQLSSIYAKTGAASQAQLMRLVLTVPATR